MILLAELFGQRVRFVNEIQFLKGLPMNPITRRHQELRRLHEAAVRDRTPHRFMEDFRQLCLEERRNLATMFSIRKLFEEFIEDGHEAVRLLDNRSSGGFRVQESAAIVSTALFANIIGQIAYTATLNGYETPGLIGDQLFEVIQTPFSGEKIPGIGRIGDDMETVAEGDPYPNAIINEEYVETPETIKRGLILNVTREAIFFDYTHKLLNEFSMLGKRVAVNREKRMLDVAFGITTIYKRNGAAAEATYGSDNSASVTLSDFQSLNSSMQLFNVQTDPTNGEPIAINPTTIVVPKALEVTAQRIVGASQVRQTTNSSNTNTYTSGNQIQGGTTVLSGSYVRNRTSSDTTWFHGDPKQAFVYMQNWPLEVTQSDETSEVGFTRDIVVRYKASERGAAAVRDRRYMNKLT